MRTLVKSFEWRWLWLAACAAVFLYSSAMALTTAYKTPYKNWDMIGYIGTMYRFEEQDQEKWYARTMDDVQKEVTPGMNKYFRELPYSSTSEALHQHLPFYKVKPAYVVAAYGLYKLGVPPVKATYMVSIASVAALLLLLFCIPLAPVDRGLWWLACSAFLFKMPYVITVLARLSTPDAMSMLLLAGLVYNLLIWRRMWLWYALSVLMVLVRPDTLVLMLLLAGLFYFSGADAMRFSRVHVAGTALGLVFTYLLVAHLSGAYGIKVFLEYSLFNKTPYPEQLTGNVTFDQYFAVVKRTFVLVAKQGIVMWMLAWTAVTVLCHWLYSPRCDTAMRIMAAAWIYLAAKVFTFGQWDHRFYYGSYFLCFTGGMMLIAPFLASLGERVGFAARAWHGR
jgi:hypothetical protein